jgi:hypothetical protein
VRLSGELLTAFGAAGVDDAAATDSCHARAETMAAGANQIAGLEGSFHGNIPYSRTLFVQGANL